MRSKKNQLTATVLRKKQSIIVRIQQLPRNVINNEFLRRKNYIARQSMGPPISIGRIFAV